MVPGKKDTWAMVSSAATQNQNTLGQTLNFDQITLKLGLDL